MVQSWPSPRNLPSLTACSDRCNYPGQVSSPTSEENLRAKSQERQVRQSASRGGCVLCQFDVIRHQTARNSASGLSPSPNPLSYPFSLSSLILPPSLLSLLPPSLYLSLSIHLLIYFSVFLILFPWGTQASRISRTRRATRVARAANMTKLVRMNPSRLRSE